MNIEFFVPGIPAPGGSKRHVGNGRIIEACKRTAPWRSCVAAEAHNAMNGRPVIGEPLFLILTFHMPRPKGHMGKRGLRPSAPMHHTVKPDCTKLLRAFEDACTGIVWADDAQVCHQTVSKVYAEGPCGAKVMITTLASTNEDLARTTGV